MFGLVLQPIFQDLSNDTMEDGGDGDLGEGMDGNGNNRHIPKITADDLYSMWIVATKAKRSIPEGHRLENLSWRLWHSSRQSLKSSLKSESSISTLHSNSLLDSNKNFISIEGEEKEKEKEKESKGEKLEKLEKSQENGMEEKGNGNGMKTNQNSSNKSNENDLIMEFKKSQAKDIPNLPYNYSQTSYRKTQLDKTSMAIFHDIQMAAQKASNNNHFFSTSLPENYFNNTSSNSDSITTNKDSSSESFFAKDNLQIDSYHEKNEKKRLDQNDNQNDKNDKNNGKDDKTKNGNGNGNASGNGNTARRRRKNIDKYFAKIKKEKEENDQIKNNPHDESLFTDDKIFDRHQSSCESKRETRETDNSEIKIEEGNGKGGEKNILPINNLKDENKREKEMEKKESSSLEQQKEEFLVRKPIVSRGFQPSNSKFHSSALSSSSSSNEANSVTNSLNGNGGSGLMGKSDSHHHKSDISLLSVLLSNRNVTNQSSPRVNLINRLDGSRERGEGREGSESINNSLHVCCSPPVRPSGPIPSIHESDNNNNSTSNLSANIDNSIISFESMNNIPNAINANNSNNASNANNDCSESVNSINNGTSNINNRHERRRRNSPSSSTNNDGNINAKVETPLSIW